jgi:hypothetical protein
MLESQLQSKLLKELRKHGWFYKASDRYRAGVPDIIGCCRGRFVALELKIEPNRPTPLQEYEMKAIYREDGYVNVVSYNNKTKTYKTKDTEHTTLGETVQCILKQIHSNIKGSVSKK